MAMEQNLVGWFEIPAADMERAILFYESVFAIKLMRNQMGPLDMAWFPWAEGKPGAPGSLVRHPDHYQPSTQGTLVYFSAPSGDLANELARVEPAGGKVCVPKRLITPDIGYMAVFNDTEGNRVALHSRK